MMLGAACSFPSVVVADPPPEPEPECVTSEDCPASTNPCLLPVCDAEDGCGTVEAMVGTACDATGVCVVGAVCGDCLEPDDCTVAGETCSEVGRCVPSHCDDTVASGDETDVDCGGSCDPCAEGQACSDDVDCDTGLCRDMVCVGCNIDTDCGMGEFCNTSDRCEPRRDDGEICTRGEECESGHCPADDGVCCATACTDRCASCFEPKHEVAGENGTCHLIPDGSDPDGECPVLNLLNRTCNGEGMCRFR